MKTLFQSSKGDRLIIFAYLSLFVLLIIAGSSVFVSSIRIGEGYSKIIDRDIHKLRLLRNIRETGVQIQSLTVEKKFHSSWSNLKENLLSQKLKKNKEALTEFEKYSNEGKEKEMFKKVVLAWEKNTELRNHLIGLNDREVIKYYNSIQKPVHENFYNETVTLSNFIYDQIKTKDEKIDGLLNSTKASVNGLISIVIILLVVLGFLVFKNVKRINIQNKLLLEKENKLSESELLYKELFNNSPVFTWVCEFPTLKHLEVNEMAVSHYGYTKEEFLSMTAYDLLPEEDRKILRDRVKNSTGKQFVALDRHVKKNGEIIDVEIRGHVINYRGKKAGLVTGVDVTEKLKTEVKLKQQEEFYRSITENSSDIQFVTDKEGKITFASRPIFKNFGFISDEIIGKTSKDFWHPDDFKKNKEKILELVENPGSSIHIEIRSLDKNNSYHWCEAKISNQLHNPCINGFVSNYSDITERKTAEEKIKASEKLYYSLFDKSPLPIFVVEKKRLQFIEVNDTAIEMYGYSREELLKMTVFDLRVKEDQESLKEVLIKGDTDDYQNYNVRHIKKNGEKIIVDVTIENIEYKGEVAYLGIVKDITKTVELQNQLNEEKVGKQKEITRATIDGQEKERAELGKELHDNVNQILASAKLYLSCARSVDINKKNELVDESMGLIDSGIQEIRKLSKSLVPPALSKSTLKESIEELVDPVRITTDKRIDTNFSLPDESILCDRLKITIYRMIQEQMNNILRYADASRIRVVLKQDRYKLLLQVKDNGKGFDVKAKRKGIGLTNIANRAEVYNGKVVIDSAPGNGCTLSVFFPLEQLEKLRDGVISMTTPGMTA